MDNNKHPNLLSDFIARKIDPEQLESLKENIDSLNDGEVEQLLEQEWNNFEPTKQYSREFDEIGYTLNLERAKKEKAKRAKRILLTFTKIAAIVAFPIMIATMGYLMLENSRYKALTSNEFRVKTAKGESTSVVLPDGTKIRLNSNSRLSYNATFSKNDRTVRLVGEAYFDVAHNKELPFVVKTNVANVKVLGTVFNIRAYTEEKFFEASLVSGSVEVSPLYQPEKRMRLRPNQKAYLDKEQRVWSISNTDLWQETSWKEGNIVFRSKKLDEIFTTLESYYGLDIDVVGSSPKELFTGSFHEESIQEVLLQLQEHYQFTYSKLGNKVVIQFN